MSSFKGVGVAVVKSVRFWLFLGIFFIFIGSVVGAPAKLIDLDFKNADIKDVLRALADQEGVSFMIDPDVTGSVTIHLTKVTFTEALNILAKNYGLQVAKENGIYHVTKLELIRVEYAGGLLSVEAKEARLRVLIERIAAACGVSLVTASDISERVTLAFQKTTFEDGLKVILTHTNCYEEKVGTVYFIKKRPSDKAFSVIYRNNLLSVDAQNIPLTALAREITAKSGISVVPDQNLNANISIFFQDLTMKDALNVLCETNSLQPINDGAVWRIIRKSGSYRIRVVNNQLSVDVDNADIVTVLNEIGRQSGVNILIARDVQGPITAHFQNLPFYQGLMAMLETRGLVLEKQQNYYYVRSNPANLQNLRISYDPTTKLYDLEIQSSPLTNVINELARKAGVNVVVLSQVNWTLNNIRLQKVSFDEALDFMLKGTIFTWKITDGTYLIGDGLIIRPENADFAVVKLYPIRFIKADQLINTLPPIFPRQDFVILQEKNAIIVTAPPMVHDLFAKYLNQVDIESVDNRTEVIRIKNLKAEDVLKLIPPSIPKTDIIVIKESNALAVTGPQNLINQVKQYIEKIDQVNPMIVFDILVIQISDSKGLTWTPPSGSFKLQNGNEVTIGTGDPTVTIVKPGTPAKDAEVPDKLMGTLTALLQNGKAKILANPTISTLNGYQVSFNVSTKWSFTVPTETVTVDSKTTTQNETVKTYESGLNVSILPWVSANNQITMEIKPKISEFGEAPKGSFLPSTSERSTETTIRINNKETIIISGLRNTRKQKSVSKVPLLGDIPLLGNLFKRVNESETQDEFIIFITPYLVYDDVTRAEANKKILDRFNPEVRQTAHPEEKVEPEKKQKQKK